MLSKRGASCTAKCLFAEVYAVDLVRCLIKANLWPTSSLRDRTLYEILEDDMALLEEVRSERCLSCGGPYASACAKKNSMEEKAASDFFRARARSLMNGIKKACLKCCEEGKGLRRVKCEHAA